MVLKRFVLILATFCLVFLWSVRAQETKDRQFSLAGFDDTSMRQWEDTHFFDQMEKQTGVSFSLHQYTDADQWRSYKASLSAKQDLPDVLFKAALSPQECQSLREQGVLIDLKPYLPDCMPHLWTILQERPALLEAITLQDGSIAALPYINLLPKQNLLWINQQWLDNLNLSQPQTAQELVDVLSAFQTRDPNKNGRADEIPLGFLGPFDLKFLAHAFGLVSDDYNLFLDAQGQVRYMPLEENFRMFITWCRDLYQAGLMDKNGFLTADTFRKVTEEKTTPVYGAVFAPNISSLFQVSWADQYVPLLPLEYEGKRIYRDFFGPLQRGTFAVTSACASPETVLRWVDFLYTEEGGKLVSAGQENEDYLVDGDGTWRLVDAAKNNATFFIATAMMDGGAPTPGVTPVDFIRRFSGQSQAQENTMERQQDILKYCVQPMPPLMLTDGQQTQVAEMQFSLGAYVDMHMGRWILGEEEISDASFAAFREELENLGLSSFLAIWQEAANRY